MAICLPISAASVLIIVTLRFLLHVAAIRTAGMSLVSIAGIESADDTPVNRTPFALSKSVGFNGVRSRRSSLHRSRPADS